MPPFPLLVVTPPAAPKHEHATLRKLFDRGLQTLHLRRPGLSSTELGAWLDALGPEYRAHVVLHQRHKLAPQLGVKGIHLRVGALHTAAVPATTRHRAPPAPRLSLAHFAAATRGLPTQFPANTLLC